MQAKIIDIGLGGGSLIQVANRTLTQMMTYIVDTPDGKTIVIDGGNYCKEDAEALYSFIAERGKKVELWIMTHAHLDHIGGMLYLMDNGLFDIEVGKVCLNFPSLMWLSRKEEFGYNWRFFEQLKAHGIELYELQDTDVLHVALLSPSSRRRAIRMSFSLMSEARTITTVHAKSAGVFSQTLLL